MKYFKNIPLYKGYRIGMKKLRTIIRNFEKIEEILGKFRRNLWKHQKNLKKICEIRENWKK